MDTPDRPEPVDLRILADMLDDDRDAMAEMLAEFRLGAHRTAVELRAACQAGLASETAALAHRLKSSARWVGAVALGDVCAAMERAGRAGQGNEIIALMAQFEAELSRVERFLGAR